MISLGEEKNIYQKRHLVPFGEYFPVTEGIRSWMQSINLPSRDIAKGDRDQQPFNLGNLRMLPLFVTKIFLALTCWISFLNQM